MITHKSPPSSKPDMLALSLPKCLRRSLMIVAHVSMMVLVIHGADETPSAGLADREASRWNCHLNLWVITRGVFQWK